MTSEVEKDLSSRMDASVKKFKESVSGIRTGRASSDLLNAVMVDYYNTQTPLRQLCSVQVPEANLIVLNPFDQGAIAGIKKAIVGANLGINPDESGGTIRLVIPPLTQERRLEMVKLLKSREEEAKVVIRNIRRNINDKLNSLHKDKEISDDDLKRRQDWVQSQTDAHVDKIASLAKQKEQELMTA